MPTRSRAKTRRRRGASQIPNANIPSSLCGPPPRRAHLILTKHDLGGRYARRKGGSAPFELAA